MLYIFKKHPLFTPFYPFLPYFSVQLLCNLIVVI
nr:MAG TPA: hypothetical protein [Caudoviricetes sp.]